MIDSKLKINSTRKQSNMQKSILDL